MAKVLVADDSLSVRKVVERCLGTRGIEVLSVGSGSEAIERIERDEPDLVVCDVIMPDRDGFEICHFVTNSERDLTAGFRTRLIVAYEGPLQDGHGAGQHSFHWLWRERLSVARPIDGHWL